VLKNIPQGKDPLEGQETWLDNVENYLKKTGVGGWRKIAKDRDTCKLILKGVRFLHGP